MLVRRRSIQPRKHRKGYGNCKSSWKMTALMGDGKTQQSTVSYPNSNTSAQCVDVQDRYIKVLLDTACRMTLQEVDKGGIRETFLRHVTNATSHHGFQKIQHQHYVIALFMNMAISPLYAKKKTTFLPVCIERYTKEQNNFFAYQ